MEFTPDRFTATFLPGDLAGSWSSSASTAPDFWHPLDSSFFVASRRAAFRQGLYSCVRRFVFQGLLIPAFISHILTEAFKSTLILSASCYERVASCYSVPNRTNRGMSGSPISIMPVPSRRPVYGCGRSLLMKWNGRKHKTREPFQNPIRPLLPTVTAAHLLEHGGISHE